MPLAQGLPTADWLHLYTEAARLAFADRAQYVADPDFVQAPAGSWSSLLEPAYLAARAKRIDGGPSGKRMKVAPAGTPGAMPVAYAPMPDQPEYGTSHISIVDRWGQALAMTTTIEDGWGARLMVNRGLGLRGGFLLNNELTDFSFTPTDADGKPVANRVEPGKRPRSSMAPTLVFDKASGQLVMSTGSPGGAFIIHFTAKTLLRHAELGTGCAAGHQPAQLRHARRPGAAGRKALSSQTRSRPCAGATTRSPNCPCPAACRRYSARRPATLVAQIPDARAWCWAIRGQIGLQPPYILRKQLFN